MKIITKKSIILSSLTTLLFVLSCNTHAKIYKWTDANGQTHYTAHPPTQAKIKSENIEDKIKSNAGKYRPPSNTQKVAAVSVKADEQADEKIEEELAGPDKQLIKYCDSQRKNVEQLQKNFRNIWVDAKGNKTNLTQEQRKEKVAKLRSDIQKNCSDVKPTQS